MNRRFHGIWVGFIAQLALRAATQIVVLNSQTRAGFVTHGFGSKVIQLTNAVEDRFFHLAQERPPASVLFVGYLVRHKGVLDLLDAWAMVLDSRPASSLVLAGPFSDDYREVSRDDVRQIKRSAAELGVTLTGHVNHERVLALFKTAEVFCLPSYAEGMPNSLLEAVACGCRVVISDIPGTHDLVLGGVGERVAAGDVIALAEALIRAVDAGPPSAEATNAARMPLSWQSLTPIYERMYSRGDR